MHPGSGAGGSARSVSRPPPPPPLPGTSWPSPGPAPRAPRRPRRSRPSPPRRAVGPGRAGPYPTELVQPGPGGLVAPDPQLALQPQGAHPVLLARDQPHGPEPHRQRLAGALEDRARDHRRLVVAAGALDEIAPSRRPSMVRTARRTAEPVGPTQLAQVRPTGLPRRRTGARARRGCAGSLPRRPPRLTTTSWGYLSQADTPCRRILTMAGA